MSADTATAPVPDVAGVKIPLTNGGFVIVDPEDAPRIRQYEWYRYANGRAARWETTGPRHSPRRFLVQLHRELMAPAPGMYVVSLNDDRLDCRRANLLVCDHATLMQRRPTWKKRVQRRPQDRSQYCGVQRRPRKGGAWRARLVVDGQRINSQYFRTDEEAARAYDALARQHYGPAAHLNFPDGDGEAAE